MSIKGSVTSKVLNYFIWKLFAGSNCRTEIVDES